MAKIKLTKEEENAMRIQAMLQGVSFDDMLTSNMVADDDEDDDDIVIVDEQPKKKGSKRKKAESKPVAVPHLVPELEQFKGLNRNLTLDVYFNEHDIPYKEQLWRIDGRTITYKVEIVKIIKIAKDVAKLFSKSEDELRKAEEGLVRYFRVINYDENVSHNIREIAYIRVENTNGKLSTKTYIRSGVLKDNNASPDKVKANIKKLVKEIA